MMKTSLKMSIATGLAALLVSFGASADKTFNIGGDAEYDITAGSTTFTKGTGAIGSSSHTAVVNGGKVKGTNEGGRVKLNAKARIDNENGSFVEAVVQPLFSYSDGKNSTAGTDDTYIKFGKKAWDVQLGRFEGVDLFPLGKDTVFTRASSVSGSATAGVSATSATGGLGYSASNARGRSNDDVIQGAAHFNVGKTQVELGAAYKDANGVKTTGIRPVVKFDAGRFRVAAGYDMVNVKDAVGGTNKTAGYGLTLGTTVGTVSGNLNFAQGKNKINGASGNKMTSIGLNGSRGRFGAGYVYDKTQNTGKQNSLYAAYTVPLMGSKDATVTFAANTSKAKYDNGDTAKNNSLRARFNYAF